MPSCGAQNLFRLGAPTNFDRCAIFASLHHPPGALRRRCPARACRAFKPVYTIEKERKHRLNRCFLFLAGAEGLEPSARGFGAVLNVFQVMFYRVFICFLVQDTQKQSQLFSQY